VIGNKLLTIRSVKANNAIIIVLSLQKSEAPEILPRQNVMYAEVPLRVPGQSSRLPRRSGLNGLSFKNID